MKRTYHRREAYSGVPMLGKLPKVVEDPKDGYYNSGEGGMAFFFCVKEGNRKACCVEGPRWGVQDVCFNRSYCVPEEYRKAYPEDYYDRWHMILDCGMLIGSTGLSLWSKKDGNFKATFKDLTADGKALYRSLEKLYGKGSIDIVTLLDT